MTPLEAFLQDRTVGYSATFSGWYWRGCGYDDGWVEMTADEVTEFKRLTAATT